MGAAGLTHLAVPHIYTGMVPKLLPGSAQAWTALSGVAELAVSGMLIWPRTRRLGATAAAVLFVVVFPANLQMALDWGHRAAIDQVIAWARLPLQVPLVGWALWVRARERPVSPARSEPAKDPRP